jgi:hypothetical protein
MSVLHAIECIIECISLWCLPLPCLLFVPFRLPAEALAQAGDFRGSTSSVLPP